MADQLSGVNRSSDAKPDEEPTLILHQLSYSKSDKSTVVGGAQKEESSGEACLAEDPGIASNGPPLRTFGRLKKFCTSSPSRKVASAVSAIMIAALSGIAGTLAPSFIHSQMGRADVTQRVLYAPWIDGDTLSPSLHIARTIKGFCWTQSDSTPRDDAYRCMQNSGWIYDPCFSDDSQKSVVCPTPSPVNVTSIQLGKPLPEPEAASTEGQATSGPTVWLIDLADGDDCYRISAASYSPAGMPLTYTCKNGNLYGELNRTGKTWTIWEQKKGSADLTIASIAKAYT